MSVKEVPMWRVECDVCGQGNDGEFWAWTEKEHALDEWSDDGYDIVLDDGRTFHRDCLPAEFCQFGDRGVYAHTPDDDNPGMCVECEKPIPELAPACTSFSWIGQSFAHCDACGRPYWEHTHRREHRPGAALFAADSEIDVPITPEEAEACRRKWERVPS